MEILKIDAAKETLGQSLGMEDERVNELEFQTNLIIQKFNTPTRSGDIDLDLTYFLKECVELDETLEEKIFQAYQIGRYVEANFD